MRTLIDSNIGDYYITEFLGAGGMGEVYRAVHSKLGRNVAVKILTQADRDTEFNQRFLNEARVQASLHHKNIATLFEFLEFDGKPSIVMEYVDGQTLFDRINGPDGLSLSEIVSIFRSIVEAISYIHNKGIVHRDIKSNNIKVSSSGEVKLLDFGIAKANLTPRLTAAGSVIGTWEYMAPEQLQTAESEARTDIWSLGVLLYEMATGRLPFESQIFGELYEQICNGSYKAPSALNPSVPREMEVIISRCLAKKPSARYQSAEEILQDLDRIRVTPTVRKAVAGIKPTRVESGVSASTDVRSILSKLNSSPKLVASGITAFSFLIISFGFYLWFDQKEPKENFVVNPLVQPKSQQTPSQNPDPTLKPDLKLSEQELKLPEQNLNSQILSTQQQSQEVQPQRNVQRQREAQQRDVPRQRKAQRQQVAQQQPATQRQPETRQPDVQPQAAAQQQPNSGKAAKIMGVLGIIGAGADTAGKVKNTFTNSGQQFRQATPRRRN